MSADDNKPATKADISHLNQKIDATKTDISHLDQKIDATKTDISHLDQKIDRVASAVVNLQSEFMEFKQTTSTKEDINRILNAIDSFAGKAQNYDRASVLHGRALVEVEVKVQDHEKRLKKLEKR